MFAFLIVVMASQVYTYVKTYPTARFKYAQLLLGRLYRSKAVKTTKSGVESNSSSRCGEDRAAAGKEAGSGKEAGVGVNRCGAGAGM